VKIRGGPAAVTLERSCRSGSSAKSHCLAQAGWEGAEEEGSQKTCREWESGILMAKGPGSISYLKRDWSGFFVDPLNSKQKGGEPR